MHDTNAHIVPLRISVAFDDRPIFVLGRQHSGNTMLTTILGRHKDLFAAVGESTIIEHFPSLKQLPRDRRPAAVARYVGGSMHPALTTSQIEQLRSELETATAKQDNSTVEDLYSTCMHLIAKQSGKTRWAQKATSFIFYIDRILETFPQAQFIFLTRNPFDIAASTKRRNGLNHIYRSLAGWNKGVRRALHLQRSHGHCFSIVRYEDIVEQPEATIRKLMQKLGHEFHPDQLDIAHVNKSENAYNTNSKERGLNKSRIHYFRDVLTDEEQQIVRFFTNDDTMNTIYPILAENVRPLKRPKFSLVAQVWLKGNISFMNYALEIARQDPRTAVDRVFQRLMK